MNTLLNGQKYLACVDGFAPAFLNLWIEGKPVVDLIRLRLGQRFEVLNQCCLLESGIHLVLCRDLETETERFLPNEYWSPELLGWGWFKLAG